MYKAEITMLFLEIITNTVLTAAVMLAKAFR